MYELVICTHVLLAMLSLNSWSRHIFVQNVTIELTELSVKDTKDLVFRLGVRLNDIDRVDHAQQGSDVAKGHLVSKWVDSDTEAGWKKLCSELRAVGKECLANEIESKHVPDVTPAAVSTATDRVTPERSPSLGATDDSDIDYKIKIVLCGESGVGKTCFVDEYVSKTIKMAHKPTVEVNYEYKKLKLQDKRIKMQIIDTAGQERYKGRILHYLKGVHGVILMYDVTEEDSFKNINKWLKDIQKHAENFTKIVIVGNKIDRKNDRKITSTKGNDLANSHSLRHF